MWISFSLSLSPSLSLSLSLCLPLCLSLSLSLSVSLVNSNPVDVEQRSWFLAERVGSRGFDTGHFPVCQRYSAEARGSSESSA